MSTKRERLLDWIRHGDPEDVPVMIGPWSCYLAASYFGKEPSDITWADAARAAEETGTHNAACAYSPLPFDAIDFIDDIELTEVQDKSPEGIDRTTCRIETPEGTLTEIREDCSERGNYHREFFVKGDEDIAAFACFIRKAAEATVSNPAVRKRVESKMNEGREAIGGALPSMVHVFCPAVELRSSYYMDQSTAIYTLFDQRDLMEELMNCHAKMTDVWLEATAAADLDMYSFAINGYEWLSPDEYDRYMIPQAKRICDFARAQGKLSWIHTCGKLKEIAEAKTYQQMGVDIVESLSSPPTGDIDDLSKTRQDIGPEIATRGGVNCELFYEEDPTVLRQQTEHVLDSVKGFKHMIGDTNPSTPAYPWKNFKAVIDVVRDRGRLFE